jgi:hypothetical protein
MERVTQLCEARRKIKNKPKSCTHTRNGGETGVKVKGKQN